MNGQHGRCGPPCSHSCSRPRRSCRCAGSAPTTTRAPRAWPPPSGSSRCSSCRCPNAERAPTSPTLPRPGWRSRTSASLPRAHRPGARRPLAHGRARRDPRARRAQRVRQVDAPERDARARHRGRGSVRVRRRPISRNSIPTPGDRGSHGSRSSPHLFRASLAENVRLGRIDASDDAVRAAIGDAGARETCSSGCLTASTRCSATAAPACRPASVSGSRSRARSCAMRRCCCSTSRTANLDGDTEHEVSTRSEAREGTHRGARRAPAGARWPSPSGCCRSPRRRSPRERYRPRSAPFRTPEARRRRSARTLARCGPLPSDWSLDVARRGALASRDRPDRHVCVADLTLRPASRRSPRLAVAIVGRPVLRARARPVPLRERLISHDAAFRIARRAQRQRLHPPGAPRSAGAAGVPQRRPAGAPDPRRRLAAGPAAAGASRHSRSQYRWAPERCWPFGSCSRRQGSCCSSRC